MASVGNPQFVPYENIKDCNQGFCSLYCPQWCYIIFPPPPPLAFPDDDSKTNFSPLVIAIIGILASAFLLVSYYTVISKYCGNMDSTRRNPNQEASEESNEQSNNGELWHVSTGGLEEGLIKLIAVCKYNKGEGLVEGTDCSVCLGEFQENESLRLLPKCTHAFHLPCIDTWLKSHSNCPLCRANVIITIPSDNGSSSTQNEPTVVVTVEDSEDSNTDIVIEIKDEEGGARTTRRSVSMDSGRVSIADILSTSEDEDESDVEMREYQAGVESSSSKRRNRVLRCVATPTAIKRSVSSGRFLFTRQGRARM